MTILTHGALTWDDLPTRIISNISVSISKKPFRVVAFQLQDEHGFTSKHTITVDLELLGTIPAIIQAQLPHIGPILAKQVKEAYNRLARAQQAVTAIEAEFPNECALYGTAPKGNFIDKIWREVADGLEAPTGKPIKSSFSTGRQALKNYRTAIIGPVIEAFKVERFVVASPHGQLCQIISHLGWGSRDNMHALCCRPNEGTNILSKWGPNSKMDFLPYIQQKASLRFSCWIIDGRNHLRLPATVAEAQWAASLDRMEYDGPDERQPLSKEYRTTNRLVEG